MNRSARRNLLALRRACSTHARVARVSRLIGNSDTTAKPVRVASARYGGKLFSNGREEAEDLANARNATPRSGVSCLPGHWPPSQVESGVCFHRSVCRLPGWLFPFEGRSLAVARAGCPVLLRLAGRSSSGRYITGAYNVAIQGPFGTLFLINNLCRFRSVFVLILVAEWRKFFKKV